MDELRQVDFERNLGFLLGDVARLTRTAFDRRVASLELTRSQWWVLTYVFRDQGLTQSELADNLEIGKVALGNLIDRLEAKGWVERRPDPNDRRINRVYLTEKAAPIMEDMRAPAQDLYDMIVSGLSKSQRETLVDLLLVVRRNLIEDSNHGK
jgi:MarR family transcriptional regulator for hemolysin